VLTSAYVWLGIVMAQAESPAPAAPSDSGSDSNMGELITQVIGPILGTGLVGAFLIMVIFRIKLMPTYVHDEAKAAWEVERTRMETAHATEVTRLTAENTDLKQGLKESNLVYTQQVIPTLTRVLDAERELVDLRRDEAAERRRRGSADG
jgi:Na+-transporting methylmalonyl-CoA/oxaloacetate decarboxylase gamma subunit